MRLRRHKHPDPPHNVRVTHPNGQVIPIDCVYKGRSRDGIHEWHAVWTLPWLPVAPWAIEVESLPAQTAVVLHAEPPADDL